MTRIRVGVMLLLVSGTTAWSAELELRYAAIERVIADQLFSQDGRLYVRGNKSTRCKFAYLESPHVGAVNGRLRVSARFSGRTALDMMGACVGLGDSFDFTMIAGLSSWSASVQLREIFFSTADRRAEFPDQLRGFCGPQHRRGTVRLKAFWPSADAPSY